MTLSKNKNWGGWGGLYFFVSHGSNLEGGADLAKIPTRRTKNGLEKPSGGVRRVFLGGKSIYALRVSRLKQQETLGTPSKKNIGPAKKKFL